MNPTILTRSGSYLNLVNPNPALIVIEDIAHALGNLCRFTGHTKHFYSVAEHSVRASHWVPPEYALEALLHDATEAYLGDVSSPLKALLPEYRNIEFHLDCCIRQRFDLPVKPSRQVKLADLAMLDIERASLMPPTEDCWPVLDDIEPGELINATLKPTDARITFLARFYSLHVVAWPPFIPPI